MTNRQSMLPTTLSSASSSLTDLVLSHFDRHQRGGGDANADSSTGGGGALDAPSRAARIRDDCSSELLNRYVAAAASLENGGENSLAEDVVAAAREEIKGALLLCVDASMEKVALAKGAVELASIEQSADATLELAAAFACGQGDGTVGAAVVSRAVTLASKVQSDAIRSKACRLLGRCVSFALSGAGSSEKEPGAGRKKRRSKGKQRDNISLFLYGPETNPGEGKPESWRVECVNASGEALLLRMTDKSQAVRLAAVDASRAFFMHESSFDKSPYGEVLQGLLARLANDSSFACRAAAARAVPVTKETVSSLLERVRDVKSKVRVYALEALRGRADIVKDLSEEQRVELLRSGLTERCSETNRATVEMLCSGWMKALKFDPINLIRLLDPSANEAVCERAIRAIVTAANDDQREVLKDLSDPEIRAYKEGVGRKVNIEEANDEELSLDPAAALYLRVLCDETDESTSLSPSEKASALGKLLPDIPALGQMLKRHLDRLIEAMQSDESQIGEEATNEQCVPEDAAAAIEDAECFVCLQLLKLARRSSDLREEGSRRHFVSLMCDMLGTIETPDDLLEGCVMALHAAHDTEARYLQTVSEIVSNVDESDSMSDDSDTVPRQVRVVSILSLALEVVSAHVSNSSSSVVLDGLSSYIVPAVTSPSSAAREAGVGCLGRFALLAGQDRASTEFRPLLLRVCGNAEERMEVRAQAAMALCDLTLVFGDGADQEDQEEKEGEVSFTDLLSEMLCHSNPAMVAIAAEIVAKLLLAGRTTDPVILAHLIATFFDKDLVAATTGNGEDVDEEDVGEVGSLVRMQQILSLFFPAFAMKSREGRETLTACIRPLLSVVERKMTSRGGARKSWPIAKMIEFICSAVDAGIENQEEQQRGALEQTREHADNDANRTEAAEDTPKDAEEDALQKEKEEPSSTLLASIAITEFLAEQSASLTNTYLRALCKILGSAYIDVEIDDRKCLSCLKKNVDHLAMIITDEVSIRSLEKLIGVLDEFDSDDEGSNADDDTAASLADAVQKTTLEDKDEGVEHDQEDKDEREGGDQDGGANDSGTEDESEDKPSRFSELTIDLEGSVDYQHDAGNPASDDDDFFDDIDDSDAFMGIDDDDSSYSSKENAGSKVQGGTKKDGTDSSAPRRKSTRTRRQLANVNA